MEFRQALAKALAELMREDDKICVLDADLSKPNGTSSLYKEIPDRFPYLLHIDKYFHKSVLLLRHH